MTIVEILRAAKAKVEQGWTQGTSARDRRGNAVIAWSTVACSWCAYGAVGAVAPDDWRASDALYALKQVIPLNCTIDVYNDAAERTQTEVLAWFDAAIKLEEEAEP